MATQPSRGCVMTNPGPSAGGPIVGSGADFENAFLFPQASDNVTSGLRVQPLSQSDSLQHSGRTHWAC